ncbi:MAG: carboxypeptidase-like regulatory domain-containing protein [Bacteroidetes bacterium]|nr:carboxypeptidase-like regulatory domain-containing protein [Bacteroidota bacterium]MBK9799834.1 carboxypeptidase-like regulatory domain-containing protein [Bacteroidota bacterium]
MKYPIFRTLITTLVLAFLLLNARTQNAIAQTTRVSGKVFDSETKEPLPFVNIIFKGTRIGTTSDFDGNFLLSTSEKVDSLVFSYIGYVPKTRAIKKGISQELKIELSVNSVALKEIVIKPGENPANILFRKVVKHKDENDVKKLEAYQYETYNKIEIDINNISQKMKKRRLLKPFDFVFENIDSSHADEKPSLPMFITETLSDFYFKKNPKFKKEIIKASKVAGIKNESVSQVLGNMYQQVNIYDNAILVIDKNFTSPLSDNGLLFYRYYLIDSLFLDNHWCYHLQFKPRRKQELAFIGNMWIADTTFAVKRLEMSIPDDANINYIVALNVVQEYNLVGKNWMLSKDKLVIDFALLDKKMMGVYGRKTTSYKDIIINEPKDEKFYSKTDNLIVMEGASDKDNKFWEGARHDTLSKNEESIYHLVDTIRTLPAFKRYSDLVKTLYGGYYVYKLIELGPLFSTYSTNTIEGSRVRIGGRTSNAFSKWFELNGYVAYGFKDEKYKVGGGFRWMLQKKPTRQMLAFNYKNDYEILGQNANAFRQDNLFVSLFRRNPLSNLTQVEQYKGFYDKEWFNGFNTKLILTHRVMTPLGSTQYRFVQENDTVTIPNIKSSEIGINIRFAYGERFLDGEFDRVSLGTKSPVFQIQFTEGLKGVLNSDFDYKKIIVNIEDRLRINPIGYTNYVLQYGKIFGKIPYPLLELHPGNETFAYDFYSFNLMNYFEFVSDEYASAFVSHHFDGFFFNRIPLLRKLKLREVATGRAVIGKVSDTNRQALLFPDKLYTFNQAGYTSNLFSHNKPYIEVAAGIENILKFFRVDAVWRLSYLNHPNIAKFGIRATVQVIL